MDTIHQLDGIISVIHKTEDIFPLSYNGKPPYKVSNTARKHTIKSILTSHDCVQELYIIHHLQKFTVGNLVLFSEDIMVLIKH